MLNVNRVVLGGNVGGELRQDAAREECSFLLFSNDVTPPPDVFPDEVVQWKLDHPAAPMVHAFGDNAERVARLGKGAFLLFEGELLTRKPSGGNLLITEVRMNRLLFYRPPRGREGEPSAMVSAGGAA